MTELPPAAALWAMQRHAFGAMVSRQQRVSMLPHLIERVGIALAGGSVTRSAPRTQQQGGVLVLPVVGILAPAGLIDGGTSYEAIEAGVRIAAADSRVSAIVLAIRSPGGTVWGCAEAANAIYEARSIKPVIAVASPYSFSAAHWLATQASSYFATPSGEVGSVGVRSGHSDMSGFERKIGIRTTLIASSAAKIAAHPYGPLSDEDRAEIQASVDEQNSMFVRAISRGRGMRVGDVARIHGTGASMSARRATLTGAIDGVATLGEVIARYSSSSRRAALMGRQAIVQRIAAAL